MLKSQNIPPSSKSWPVLGKMVSFARDPLSLLINEHQQHGDLFNLDLGVFKITLIAEPDLGLDILKRSLSDFEKDPEHRSLVRDLMADGLTMSKPALWKFQRKQIQPSFAPRKMETSVSQFAALAAPHLRGFEGEQGFEPFPVFSDISIRFMMQQIFTVQATEPDIKETAQRLQQLTTDFAVILLLSKAPGPIGEFFLRRHEASLMRLRQFFEHLVAKLDIRQEFISAEARSRSDAGLIIAELVTLLIGGSDTSASTATWGLYCLAQHPEIQKDCRDEVHRVLGDRAPQAEDLRAMPQLYNVVRETLRLYPALPLLSRTPTREVQVGDYTFGPQHKVVVAPILIQRNPDLWPEPHAFKPERWRDLGPKPKGWIPFGAGPRNCIGSHLGFIETTILMALVLQRFEVLPDPRSVQCAERPKLGSIFRVRDGFRLRLKSTG